MVIDVVALDRALDRTIEAAVAPSHWLQLLNDICTATGSRGAHILPLRGTFSPGVPATPSLSDGFNAYFKEGWHLRDSRFGCLPHVLQKGVAIEHDIASDDDFRRSAYYNEFLARFGFRYSAMVGFPSGDDILSLGLQRGIADEPFNREEERILFRIRSRLTIAAEIMRRVSFERVESMGDAFDIADIACVFYDRLGHISRMNLRAERLIDDDIKVYNRELVSRRSEETVALRGHVRSLIERKAFHNDLAGSPVKFSRQNRRPLVVRAQRLTGMPADIFSHSVVLAIIVDLEERPLPPARVLQVLFKLTPQESAIASLLSSGLGLKEIAEKQQLAYETVRSHTKTVFQKTETNRQTELVALLSGFKAVS